MPEQKRPMLSLISDNLYSLFPKAVVSLHVLFLCSDTHILTGDWLGSRPGAEMLHASHGHDPPQLSVLLDSVHIH